MTAPLVTARRGSGFSSPSSNRSMKSRQASGRLRRAATTGALSSGVSPCDWSSSITSIASTSGFCSISSCSRWRSLA